MLLGSRKAHTHYGMGPCGASAFLTLTMSYWSSLLLPATGGICSRPVGATGALEPELPVSVIWLHPVCF
jgi:hypothetical protein